MNLAARSAISSPAWRSWSATWSLSWEVFEVCSIVAATEAMDPETTAIHSICSRPPRATRPTTSARPITPQVIISKAATECMVFSRPSATLLTLWSTTASKLAISCVSLEIMAWISRVAWQCARQAPAPRRPLLRNLSPARRRAPPRSPRSVPGGLSGPRCPRWCQRFR